MKLRNLLSTFIIGLLICAPHVGAEETKSQPMTAVNPGSTVEDTQDTWILQLINDGTGVALSGYSAGGFSAVYGESNRNGVHGRSASINDSGVFGENTGSGYGVSGSTVGGTQSAGVFGSSTALNGNGVIGQAYNGTSAWGVWGKTSVGIGVRGTSDWAHGVYGRNGVGSALDTTFFGYGAGVWGDSDNGWGVYGSSGTASGVVGEARGAGSYGMIARSAYGSPANAGLFVYGASVATGTKSAAVPLGNGEQVLLYAEESTEVWFSDYGSARLIGGAAVVPIDPVFLQTVDTSKEYHVFLTPKGNPNGALYVENENPSAFEIRESTGTASIDVSYRIVAKRRNFAEERLKQVALPKIERPAAKAQVIDK